MASFRPGDLVVYVKEKHSTHPGPRARNVRPAVHGDDYTYVVDKYWVVDAVEDGVLVLGTPGGKVHRVAPSDPHLRRASWVERLWLRVRTPKRLEALRRG